MNWGGLTVLIGLIVLAIKTAPYGLILLLLALYFLWR